ncbi:thiamine phosphate synthase [Acuticoccus sp.]|uniref:thiamine phosphate synthase n=1 Tax=Acuticoccus sp. TaxID=1904378 RepID=UPI003B51D0BA
MRQRLILVAPPDLVADELAAALAGGDVAAVVIPVLAARPRMLVEAAQGAGAAALLQHRFAEGEPPPWPLAFGADGVQVGGGYGARRKAVETRPEGATVGATAATRHEAMTLGEVGADFLWFGRVDALDEDGLEVGIWWQALFEVPAVVAGPADEASVALMIATRVEFIAVDVFRACGGDAAATVSRINAALAERVPS